MKKLLLFSLISLLGFSNIAFGMEADKTNIEIINNSGSTIYYSQVNGIIQPIPIEHKHNDSILKGVTIALYADAEGKEPIYQFTAHEEPKIKLEVIMNAKTDKLTVERVM